MRLKIGDRSQFYGEKADSALADKVLRDTLTDFKLVGLEPQNIYTGVKGPNIWFAIADDLALDLEQVASTLPQIGKVSRETDEQGEYLSLPLIFEPRQRRRHR